MNRSDGKLVSIVALVCLAIGVLYMRSSALKQTTNPAQLAESIEMGVVELNVSDLQKETTFYKDLAGLEVLSESETEVTLGYQNRAAVRLIHRTDLPSPAPNSAGLYHLAIVYESRAALAQAISRILETDPARYSGTADHLVSEAFYFYDPEGNGVELYFDKDPATWQWENGTIKMDSLYIDPQQYIATHGQEPTNLAKKMGHVHLKVGNIAQAKTFYNAILGFSITNQMPTALFVSDGKYHHHLGMNVWESNGASLRSETLGLNSFEILLPDFSDVQSLAERLDKHSISYKMEDNSLRVSDPWGTKLIVKAEPELF